jgi:hypothetical protein
MVQYLQTVHLCAVVRGAHFTVLYLCGSRFVEDGDVFVVRLIRDTKKVCCVSCCWHRVLRGWGIQIGKWIRLFRNEGHVFDANGDFKVQRYEASAAMHASSEDVQDRAYTHIQSIRRLKDTDSQNWRNVRDV